MGNNMKKKIIVLASPSDISDERKIVMDTIDAFNACIKKNNMYFDLRCWEECSPGLNDKGAQGLIDEELEINKSDIFICIFGSKVGTLIEGESVTGTEHELMLAIDSYEKNGKPDIKSFFKKIDKSYEDYEKIKIISSKVKNKGLYKKYDTIEEFRKNIIHILLREVLKQQNNIDKKEDTVSLKEFSAENIDDLLRKIDSDCRIVLRNDCFIISNSNIKNINVEYNEVHDGKEIVISNVNNLSLEAGKDFLPMILTKPRYASVITLRNCTNVTLNGLVIGHFPDLGACSGPVIKIINCEDINLNNLKLFGCGTVGLESYDSHNVVLNYCEIYECKDKAIYNCNSEMEIKNTTIHDIYSTYSDNIIFIDKGFLKMEKVLIEDCKAKNELIFIDGFCDEDDFVVEPNIIESEDVIVSGCEYEEICNYDLNNFTIYDY